MSINASVNERPITEINGMDRDRSYLEGYFKICESINEKRALIRKLSALSNGEKKGCYHRTVKSIREKIMTMDQRIKIKDAQFWEKVSVDQSHAKYIFEGFCSEKKFDIYDKRVLLYFLYLEFHHIMQNVCYLDELLELFDWDGSIFNRIRDNRHFREDAPLIKEGYIDMNMKRSSGCARIEYSLMSKAVDDITEVYNGRRTDSEDLSQQAIVEPCDIGCLTEPVNGMDDVVLKDEARQQVIFLIDSLGNDRFQKLGLTPQLNKGQGLNFLFYGPSGTGKSMLAQAVAKYLKRKILMVEIPKITSRWFGDTDKNISKMFSTAREKNAVLCFDEADTLLYNRSYASQEHDIRFVNIMLQELDKFEGVAVLTTNMDSLLDPALERRVSLKVKFELPDIDMRQKMWRAHIPSGVSLAKDVNFKELARKYSFSGGYIRNATMNALRKYALGNKSTLSMKDLVFAAEMEKSGMFVGENKRVPMGFVQCG